MANVLDFVFIVMIVQASAALTMMTGGWSPDSNVNSEYIQSYAEFATANISSGLNSPYVWRLKEVMSAKKQVVSGMNYKLEMEIAPTECKKNAHLSAVDLCHCAFLPCKAEICDATIWVRPWMNSTILTKYTCKPKPKLESC